MTDTQSGDVEMATDARRLLLQLSDIHLFGRAHCAELVANMMSALASVRSEATSKVEVVISGDVVDSAKLAPAEVERVVSGVFAQMTKALGSDVPILVLPGNHDRRGRGSQRPSRVYPFATCPRPPAAAPSRR